MLFPQKTENGVGVEKQPIYLLLFKKHKSILSRQKHILSTGAHYMTPTQTMHEFERGILEN